MKNKFKSITFFLFFLFIIPFSLGAMTAFNISENFPTEVVNLNYTELLHCNSTKMQSNYNYVGSAGTWKVCRTYNNIYAYYERNITNEWGVESSTNQLVSFSTNADTTEERLDYIIFYMDFTDGDGFYLDNSTRSGFFANSSGSGQNNFKTCWFFINESGLGGWVAHLGNSCSYMESSVNNLFGINDVENIDLNLDAYSGSSPNGTMKAWGAGSPGLIYDKYYDYIGFVLEDAQLNGYSYLDHINLSGDGQGYGINELPVFNFSVDKNIKCINESQNSVTFDLNITASDTEGDTIYYSDLSTINSYNTNKTVYYGKRFCVFGYCTYEADPSIFENYRRISDDICPIEIDYSDENDSFYLGKNSLYYEGHALVMKSMCDYDDDSTYYYTDDTFNKINYETTFYRMDGITLPVNLTFTMLDEQLDNEIVKIRFQNNNTHTRVYNYNGTWNELAYWTVQDEVNFRISGLEVNNSEAVLNIVGIGLYELDLNTLNEEISVFKYTIDNGIVAQHNFKYSAVGDDFTFSTTKPTEYTATSYGEFPIRLAVSDNIHQPSEYTEEIINVKIVPQEHCPNLPSPFIDTPPHEYIGDMNILALVRYFFGDNAKNFLEVMGIYETAKEIIYWFWLALFLGGMFTYFMTFKDINIVIPLLTSSVTCGFLAFVLQLTGPLIVFLIAISFTLMGPIVVGWLGGLNQQDG